MRVEELMIGDYVQVNDEACKVISISYFDIGISDSKEDFYNEHIDSIKPIPLTTKILEKNGFVKFMPHNWQIVIDNIMIELREPEHNMAIWLDWAEHNTGAYASYMFPGPNCVHELQHALRLCGIDKEIEI